MLMVMAIAGIMATLSASMGAQFLRQNRISMQANELIADLSLARTQAASSGAFVTLCKSTDGSSCAAGNWQDGYMLFVDLDGDAVVDAPPAPPAPRDAILRVAPALTAANTITATGLANANRVQYRPDGLLADIAMGSSPRLTFRITAGSLATCYREVWVDTSGRPYAPTAAQLATAGRTASRC
jgi:type IV fimbrial biogenesis protein FimT